MNSNRNGNDDDDNADNDGDSDDASKAVTPPMISLFLKPTLPAFVASREGKP